MSSTGHKNLLTGLDIRSRLQFGFIAILLMVFTAGFLGLRGLEAEMRSSIGRSSQAMARSIVEHLERQVYNRLETLRELALTTPALREALAESNLRMSQAGTPDDVRALVKTRDLVWRSDAAERPDFVTEVELHPVSEKLRGKLDFYRREAGYEVFSEIFLTNRYGANVAQTGMTSDYRQDDEDWWTGAWEDGIRMGEVAFDESSGVYSLDFALAVETAGGERLGVMKAVLDVEEIHQMLGGFESQLASVGGSLTLVDRRGARLYPSFEPPSSASAELPEDGFRLVAGEGGRSELRAVARTSDHARYPNPGWILTLSSPRETVFAPVLARRRQLLLLALAVSLVAIFFTVAISVSITRPIEHAVKVADGLAGGDLRHEPSSPAGGEAGRLLDAFSSMIANVRRTIESLVAVSNRIRVLAGGLSARGSQIAEGADGQIRAKDSGLAAVAAMSQSMNEVALSFDKVRSEVFDTSAAIEEVTASTETVSRNAGQLSRGVSETLGAVRHLASSIEKVSGNAIAAAASSDVALAEAQSGGEAVRRMAEEMVAVRSAIHEMVAVVERLAASSRRIDQAALIIEDVAKRTKLLALNAAIEAANAGEHGAGFAIVAEEIQRLSDQSASSTKEIAHLVEDVQAAIEVATRASHRGADTAARGVERAESAGERLDHIVESAALVNDGLVEIRRVSGEQATLAEELVATFSEMRNRTREVEQATGEQASAGERIRGALALLTSLAHEVSGVVRDHRRRGGEVSETMTEIAEITAGTVETVEEIVRATAELEEAAEELRSAAAFFTLE